jgi:hypothetical protein
MVAVTAADLGDGWLANSSTTAAGSHTGMGDVFAFDPLITFHWSSPLLQFQSSPFPHRFLLGTEPSQGPSLRLSGDVFRNPSRHWPLSTDRLRTEFLRTGGPECFESFIVERINLT